MLPRKDGQRDKQEDEKMEKLRQYQSSLEIKKELLKQEFDKFDILQSVAKEVKLPQEVRNLLF